MSTFKGIVHEFPDIAIDFFRPQPGRVPPLACFLSHVHSDHLAGLESLRAPFVYCSAATREILLRLEKHPSRIAYANGLREVPVRTYKHLESLLKPLPLETPTTLELEPGNDIQVTLLDANHCPGAVMFCKFAGNHVSLPRLIVDTHASDRREWPCCAVHGRYQERALVGQQPGTESMCRAVHIRLETSGSHLPRHFDAE
jgi:hypothetical protein